MSGWDWSTTKFNIWRVRVHITTSNHLNLGFPLYFPLSRLKVIPLCQYHMPFVFPTILFQIFIQFIRSDHRLCVFHSVKWKYSRLKLNYENILDEFYKNFPQNSSWNILYLLKLSPEFCFEQTTAVVWPFYQENNSEMQSVISSHL